VNTSLNLAAKPFNNRALPWVVTALVASISLVAMVFIFRATSQANRKASVIQSDITSLKQQELSLQQQAQAVKNSLSPGQLQSLNAAHELVDRKRFSWSRLFSDLESGLPGSVRVTRISVRDVVARGGQTVAELDLAVVSKTPATITEMIAGMDRTGIFQTELRSQNLQKGRGESGTEYELYVLYRPPAGSPSAENKAANLTSAETAANVSSGAPR
jgi:Tfp pilus assembly protein PilN